MRILIIAFLIYLLYRLVRGLQGLQAPRRDDAGRGDGDMVDDMVQDPNCGTYIPRSEAVVRRVNGTERHFCSEACADAYKKR